MREKILEAIYKKIEENTEDENLQKQIILLNKASISTIHSFCLDVIKNNFYEIDVSANTRIADDSEILLLQQEVIDDLFEEKYEEEDSNFIKLIKTYTKYNQDEVLKDLILRVYSYIQASPFPEEWLEEQIEKLNIEDGTNFSDTVWGKIITENANQILEDSILKLQNIRTKMTRFPELDKFTAKIEDDIDKYTYIQNNLSDWDTAVEAINTLKNATWIKDQKITNDLKDEAKDVRESTKDEFKKVKKLMNCSSEEAVQDIKYMYPILKMLKDLILEFSQKFYQRKREKNIMDFSDMEHLALKILVKKDENGNIVKDKKDTWDIYAIFYETDEKTKTLDATNRFDHPNLISIARIDEKDRKETDEWTEFYLPFVTKTGKTVDKDKLKAGKYNVAIVFSSSIEGDYFRGAVGSTLHIDEVELIHAAD